MSGRMEAGPSQFHPTRAVKFRKWLRRLIGRRHVAPMLLIAICLVSYLPGVVRLPAVDRTEVVFALTSAEMVKSGEWLDPRYGGIAQQFHPVGTNWAQGVAVLLAGQSNDRIIAIYRLPSLLAVAFAVLAVYWLMARIIGSEAALLSARFSQRRRSRYWYRNSPSRTGSRCFPPPSPCSACFVSMWLMERHAIGGCRFCSGRHWGRAC